MPTFARTRLWRRSTRRRFLPSRSATYASWSLHSPDAAMQLTTALSDLSADGYTWAQGNPMVEDQYGKLIAFVQRQNGGSKRHLPVVSNDHGVTWTEPTRTGFFDASGESALVRGAIAYDSTNDLIHSIWILTTIDGTSNGGAYYRQYSLTRDGSNNITGVTRARQMQLDAGNATGSGMEAPIALWCADVAKLLLGVAVKKTGVGAEYRLWARVPDGTANDTTSANWTAPLNEASGAGATDTLSSAILVKYSCLAKSASAIDIFLSLCRKSSGAATHAKDLCWLSVQGTGSGTLYYNRATWSAGNSDWRGGVGAAVANDAGLTTVSAIKRAGTDTGYAFKYQLISKVVEDTVNDKLWVGIPTWKDDTNGDTWTIWSISGADAASSAIDAYSATSANTDAGQDMFVTGDLAIDPTSHHLVTTYTTLPGHDVHMTTYSNGAAQVSDYPIFALRACDVPTIHTSRARGQIAVVFRDFNDAARVNPPTYTPPYQGWFVTVSYDGPSAVDATFGAVVATATGASQAAALTASSSLVAVTATATGAGQAATFGAGASIVAVTAAGTGASQAATFLATSVLAASVAAGTGASPVASLSASSGSTILAVLAAATGASPSASVLASSALAAAVATATGASPAATITAVAGILAQTAAATGASPVAAYHAAALLAAVPATATGEAPAATMRSNDVYLGSVVLALTVPTLVLTLTAPTVALALEEG